MKKLLPHPAHSKHGRRQGKALGVRSSLGALGSLWKDRKEDQQEQEQEQEEEEEEQDMTDYSPHATTLKGTHVTSSHGDNYIILSPVSPGGQVSVMGLLMAKGFDQNLPLRFHLRQQPHTSTRGFSLNSNL